MAGDGCAAVSIVAPTKFPCVPPRSSLITNLQLQAVIRLDIIIRLVAGSRAQSPSSSSSLFSPIITNSNSTSIPAKAAQLGTPTSRSECQRFV